MRFNLNSIQWRKIGPTAIFSLVFVPVTLLFFSGDLLLASLLAGAFGFGANELRQKYVRFLTDRVNTENAIAWDVEINDVKVGTITDSDYAAVRLKVFSDIHNYVAQLGNLGRMAMRVLDYCYLGIPLGVFWVMVALAVFSPDSFTAIISELQKSGPAAISSGLKVGAQFIGVLMVAVVGFHFMFEFSRFGFVNRFSEATARIVRRRCGVAAEGNMTLVRWVDGVPYFNDEMTYVRGGRK